MVMERPSIKDYTSKYMYVQKLEEYTTELEAELSEMIAIIKAMQGAYDD